MQACEMIYKNGVVKPWISHLDCQGQEFATTSVACRTLGARLLYVR
jgi:hypothetical protein